MRWNPGQYDLFSSHRATPFFDLVARVEASSPRRVVDLGCGPGTLTRTLAERWPDAEVVGVDASGDMLAEARRLPDSPPNLRFEMGDIAKWKPGSTDDVVVTNAALQWIPNHRDLLPSWLDALPPGGWLALQVPGSATNPSHVLMRDLAASDRWQPRLGGLTKHEESVGGAADYLRTLLEAGFEAQAWETTYQQVLQGDDAVLEWVRGTALRPLLAALSPDDSAEFEGAYAALLRESFPATEFGTIYPFRRIFAVGRKGA